MSQQHNLNTLSPLNAIPIPIRLCSNTLYTNALDCALCMSKTANKPSTIIRSLCAYVTLYHISLSTICYIFHRDERTKFCTHTKTIYEKISTELWTSKNTTKIFQSWSSNTSLRAKGTYFENSFTDIHIVYSSMLFHIFHSKPSTLF